MALIRSASPSLPGPTAVPRWLPRIVGGTVVVLAQSAVFVPLAFVRFVDGDEGSYALATQLVKQGELPYRDFMYPQMPVLPYLYGGWTAVVGEGWHEIRLLSALFAIGIGALLYATIAARFGGRLGAIGVGLYALSAPVYFWFPTLKTYAVPTFFLFAAYAVVARTDRVSWRRWLVAGLLAALAIDARLLFAAAVPAFAWGVYCAERDRRRSFAALAGGLVVGLAPSLLFLAIAPARFAYDTVGAHGHRSGGGLVGEFGQKARVVENVLGIGTPGGAVPQFLLLVVGALAAAAAAYVLRVRIPLALLIGAALAIGNLAPTPTYTQYFGITVPFLIAGTIELVGVVRSSRAPALDAGLRRALVGLVTVATAFYAGIGIVELQRSASLYRDQRIGSVEAVSRIVEEQTAPGERVLASWPGYLFDTDARPVAGLESDFAPDTAVHLTRDEAHRNLRASAADIEAMIRRHETRLLVVKPWHVSDAAPDWWGAARRSGYRLLTEIPAGNSEVGGAVRIYRFDGQ